MKIYRKVLSYKEYCQRTQHILKPEEMYSCYIMNYCPEAYMPITFGKVWRDLKEVLHWARDRYWFYYVIDGDEFHPSLNLNMKLCLRKGYWSKYHIKEQDRIIRDRARAHKLDAIYSGWGGL